MRSYGSDFHCDRIDEFEFVVPAGETIIQLLDNAVLGAATDVQFIGITSDVEGLSFYFVDAASPTTATAASGPSRLLRPFELTTEKPFSAGSRPAIVFVSALGIDAEVSVIYGRGGTQGSRFFASVRLVQVDFWSAQIEVDVKNEPETGYASAPFKWTSNLAIWEDMKRQSGSLTTDISALYLRARSALRRHFFMIALDTTGDMTVTWNTGGDTVNLRSLWVTTDSSFVSPLVLSGTDAGYWIFMEGELESDHNEWPGAASTNFPIS